MNSVYPSIDQWVFTQSVLNTTLQCVRPAGQKGKESGAFWLGTRESTAQISAIAFPRGTGVEEQSGYWRVSPEVFGTITRWAMPRRLCLLGIAHIHLRGVPIRPSRTDRECGVRIPGILEVIIGNGGADSDYRRWGWYVFEGTDYRPMALPEITRRVKIQQSTALEGCIVDAVRFEALFEER